MSSILERLEVRSFVPEDMDQSVALNKSASISTGMGPETGDWARDLADIQESFFGANGEFLVGHLNAEIVVMGGFKRYSATSAEIKRMRVNPDLQGQGIGSVFLKLLESKIAEKGYTEVDLSTTSGQTGALRLYSGSGYSETKRVQDGELEIVFFHKDLQSPSR